MPRTIRIEVFSFDELDDRAKEKARDWYREGALDYEWWDHVYEDAATIGKHLGIDLKQKPVKLMGGGTRYDPSIYFSGFSHQGQGCAFEATWRASDVNLQALKEYAPQDEKLHEIGGTLAEIAKAYPNATADCEAYRDVNQRVSASLNVERDEEEEHSLEEWNRIEDEEKEQEEVIEEAIRDFAHWIFKSLEKEYDYRMSDETIDEDIIANDYEFNENGTRA